MSGSFHAGYEEWDFINQLNYRNTGAILMCFSIDSPDSLRNIEEKWMPKGHQCYPEGTVFSQLMLINLYVFLNVIMSAFFSLVVVPVLLVGNKKDIRMDSIAKVHFHGRNVEPIKIEDGHAMAQKIGAFAYLECSAKLNDGVREVFDVTFRAIIPERQIICCAVKNEEANDDSDYIIHA